MVTTIRKVTGGDHPFYEFACLSTDTKPTSLVPENSICHEIDTGKHFYCSNGEWKELPPKGGSGGGGLPADFPAEGSANANKFLGFDANGDYTAKDAPSGGSAEKFVVTLTQDAQTEEWTADKTIAEIFTAYGAEKNVVVHAEQPIDIFCTGAFNAGNMKFVTFGCVTMDGTDPTTYAVLGYENQGTDGWMVNESRLPTDGKSYVPAFSPTNNGQVLGVFSGSLAWVDTNAPLIVTLTAGQEAGQYVGNMTFAEIHAAATAGRTVVFVVNIEGDKYAMYCISSSVVVESSNTVYQVYYINAGDISHFEGGASDYPSLS